MKMCEPTTLHLVYVSLLISYSLVEYYLGRTQRTKSASFVELLGVGCLFMLGLGIVLKEKLCRKSSE